MRWDYVNHRIVTGPSHLVGSDGRGWRTEGPMTGRRCGAGLLALRGKPALPMTEPGGDAAWRGAAWVRPRDARNDVEVRRHRKTRRRDRVLEVGRVGDADSPCREIGGRASDDSAENSWSVRASDGGR